jgi:mlo protein
MLFGSTCSCAAVLLVGTKLQHVIATLALENACINEFFSGAKLRPQDDLFWFKKPELLLSLIHFVLFQVSKKHLQSSFVLVFK